MDQNAQPIKLVMRIKSNHSVLIRHNLFQRDHDLLLQFKLATVVTLMVLPRTEMNVLVALNPMPQFVNKVTIVIS
jgi:hypothetical protein